jgi:Shikimate 5-dehydrogenase
LGLNATSHTHADTKSLDSNFDDIVNASSLGLKNENNIIPENLFDEKTIIYDIVFIPVKTDLIIKAKEKNCKIIFGL